MYLAEAVTVHLCVGINILVMSARYLFEKKEMKCKVLSKLCLKTGKTQTTINVFQCCFYTFLWSS